MSNRWIYGFQQTGSRDLTEAELAQAKSLSRRYSRIRYLRGAWAVLLAVGGITGIISLAHGYWWGWLAIIAGLVGLFVALSWANQAERLSLLLRRTVRVGQVDIFTRVGSNRRVRSVFRAPFEDGEDAYVSSEPYWEAEEKFEEGIRKEVDHEPETIESPKDDDAIVLISGRWVTQIHEIAVFDLEKGST